MVQKERSRRFLIFIGALFGLTCGLAAGWGHGSPALASESTGGLFFASETPRGLDVPFVETTDKVVETMLDVARVGKGDILYDLGCGDGRIVIAAARAGARGVGIDLDPERIKESKRNAGKAHVTNRVRFFVQDLFEADLREATVVTLYLLPSVNLRLRPKLLRELKPGTRVVSHDFDMDDWEPDQRVDVEEAHSVYYWVIPANVSGTWEWQLPGRNGNERHVLQLNQKFQKIEGTLSVGNTRIPVVDAQVKGDRLSFLVEEEREGTVTPLRFEGRVSGHSIEGKVLSRSGSNSRTAVWKAARDPSTLTPLDDAGPVRSIRTEVWPQLLGSDFLSFPLGENEGEGPYKGEAFAPFPRVGEGWSEGIGLAPDVRGEREPF